MGKIIYYILILMAIVISLNAESLESSAAACEEGNAKACLEAGRIYSSEAYKDKNYNRKTTASIVAAFYRKSCKFGHAQGCTAYGMSYMADKNRDIQKDAIYYFRKGCEGGDETGCNLMRLASRSIITPISDIGN